MPTTSMLRPATPGRDEARWLTDRWVEDPPLRTDMAKLAGRLDPVLTAEVTSPGVARGADFETILVAALGCAIARTVGPGSLAMVLDGEAAQRSIRLQCRDLRGADATHPAAVVAPGGGAGAVRVSYRSCVAGTAAPDGHLLALHARRGADVIYLNWWYDTRSFDRHTIVEFDEQLPLALIEVVSG